MPKCTYGDVNPGDLVRIRDWDDMKAEYGIGELGSIDCKFHFASGMRYLCGEEFTVEEVFGDGSIRLSPKLEWHISLDMIEPVGAESSEQEPNTEEFLSVMMG